MKKVIENIKNNRFLRFLVSFIKVIFTIFVILIMSIVLIQKFSNNNLSFGGYRLFTIISDSMVPKYKITDMLLAKETEVRYLKKGDDIVYNGEVDDFAGKTVVHQLIDIKKVNGEYELTTKGLANTASDPIVKEHQVVGKIVYKTLVLSFISKIVNNIYGFYFVILIPVSVLVFIEIVRTVDERKKKKENKSNISINNDEEVL